MATEKAGQDTRGSTSRAAASLVGREGVSGLTIERLAGEGMDPATAKLAADGPWFADLPGLARSEGRPRQELPPALSSLTESTRGGRRPGTPKEHVI